MTDKLTKVTPYYLNHIENNAIMMNKGGWMRPLKFTEEQLEVEQVRTNLGLIDAHSMGKFEIVGKDAKDFIQYLITNDLDRIKPGYGAIYTCICDQAGGIVDDIVVYYLNDTHFYFITNTLSATRVEDWLKKVLEKRKFDIFVINATNKTAYLAVQGPNSAKFLLPFVGEKLLTLEYYSFINVKIFDIPVLLARTGYTGELGFELNFPSEYGYFMWKTLQEQFKY